MKTSLAVIAVSMAVFGSGTAQAQSAGDLFKSIFGSKPSKTTTSEEQKNGNSTVLGSVLSQSDAQAGLKEALVLGAKAVSSQLSAENGYFGDNQIKIPLPGALGKVQKNLGKFGLAAPLDDLQLRMNRAAEKSAPMAANLVIDAVESLTIEDAIALVKGGDTSATDLLRLKTYDKLEQLLRPQVESALDDAGALKALDSISGKYDLGQLNVNPRQDLVDHAVDKALDGLFFYLAKEEQDIRKNPVDRTTDLLRRVFGG